MELRSKAKQRGLSLTGLVFLLGLGGVIAVLGLRVFPTVSEYMSIKKAIVSAKAMASSPAEARTAFDKQAEVGYIQSISGKDLEIRQADGVLDISFSYQKVIPLAGPASLLLEYEGTTAPAGTRNAH